MGDFGNIGLVNPNFDGSHVSTGSYNFTPTYEILYVDFSSMGTENVDVAGVTYNARDTVALSVIPGLPYTFDCLDDLSINGMMTTQDISISRVRFTTTAADVDVCISRTGTGGAGPLFVQWETTTGDGIGSRRDVSFIPAGFNTSAEHIFLTAGTYDVSIAAAIADITFEEYNTNFPDAALTAVTQVGNIEIGSKTFKNSGLTTWTGTGRPLLTNYLDEAFMGTPVADIAGINNWNVASVESVDGMFRDCSNFNSDLSDWNTGVVTGFPNMFRGCTTFNQPLNTRIAVPAWQIGSAESLESMFEGATSFNQPLSNWNVVNVLNMQATFSGARAFDQDISSWDTGLVTSMDGMFRNTTFNQPLNWNVETLTALNDVFRESHFNSDISGWYGPDVTAFPTMNRTFMDASLFNTAIPWIGFQPTTLNDTFNGALAFNQDVSGWDTGGTTDFCGTFHNAKSFNKLLAGPNQQWNMTLTTNTRGMFQGASSFNQALSDWSMAKVRTMNSMFRDASVFNQPLADWSVGTVTDMGHMFRGAAAFGHDLSGWDVSGVDNYAHMFDGATDFSGNIAHWPVCHNVGGGGDMQYMFRDTSFFNEAIDVSWGVSGIALMKGMFERSNFNQPLEGWGSSTQAVLTMEDMFKDNTVFNQHVNTWNAGSVTSTRGMFQNSVSFNGAINWGTTGSLVDTGYMFHNAQSFDQDVHYWDVSGVTDMGGMFGDAIIFQGAVNWSGAMAANVSGMFRGATMFDGPVAWNMIGVTNMNSMFRDACMFDGYIGDWSVGNVINMGHAFEGAATMNTTTLSSWDVSNVTDMTNMFSGAINFRGDVAGWALTRCTSFGDRMFEQDFITSTAPLFNWSICGDVSTAALAAITGDSSGSYNMVASVSHPSAVFLVPDDAFVTHWDPPSYYHGDSNSDRFDLALPLRFNSDVSVSWGQGRSAHGTYSFHGTNDISHTYWTDILDPGPPNTVVAVKGDISGWNTEVGFPVSISSKAPDGWLREVLQCGTLRLAAQNGDGGDFQDCSMLTWSASDSPDMHGITDLSKLFKGGNALKTAGSGSFSSWDVSGVTRMFETFRDCNEFNGDNESGIETWDTSNVTNMYGMFRSAWRFNGDISSWNVGGVTDMGFMFTTAQDFDRDLNKWDVGLVENMDSMFQDAVSFSGDVTGWEPIWCTTFENIFPTPYIRDNQPMLNWLVGSDPGMDVVPGDTFRDQIAVGGAYSGMYSIIAETTGDNRIVPVSGHVMKWEPSGNVISIPVLHKSDISIAWGDNTGTYLFSDTSDISHSYVDGLAGDRTIVIRGDLSGWNAGSGGGAGLLPGDKLKLIQQLGRDLSFSVADQSGAFANCTRMDWNAIQPPDFEGIGTLSHCFLNCTSLTNGSFLSYWDISGITSFNSFLDGCTSFNGVIDWSGADISQVTSMNAMFRGCAGVTGFDQDISQWQVGKVVDMSSMFEGATYFTKNLRDWDVTNVTSMNSMFRETAYDSSLTDWSAHNVLDMANMFRDNTSFNQGLFHLNPTSVLTMDSMLRGATGFRDDLTNWNVRQCTNFNQMLDASYFLEVNPMLNWSICGDISTTLLGQITGDYSGGYSVVPDHRDDPNSHRLVPVSGFVTRWEVSGSFTNTFPIEYATDVSVAWGDRTATQSLHDVGLVNHIYTDSSSSHTIVVRGVVPWDGYLGGVNSAQPEDNLHGVLQCGTDLIPNEYGAFINCRNMIWSATDAPNLHGITALDEMFRNCASLSTPNFSAWDMSGIQYIDGMFEDSSLVEGSLNVWNVSNLLSANSTFEGCVSFNEDLNDWSVGNLTNAIEMFKDAQSFNQDLYNWDMSNVVYIRNMFDGATSFSGDLTGWDVRNVTNFDSIFASTDYVTNRAPMFNWTISGPIAADSLTKITSGNSNGLYITTSVEDGFVKLGPSGAFLTKWEPSGNAIILPITTATDVSVAWGNKGPTQSYSDSGGVNPDNITYTFTNNDRDNYVIVKGPITWNAKSGLYSAGGPGDKLKAVYHCGTGLRLSNTAGVFKDCSQMVWKAQDQPLNMPTRLDQAFMNCASLGDASLMSWDVSSVTDMTSMFEGSDTFNGYIDTWDVSNVTSMNSMFKNCLAYDQSMIDWSVHSVVDMCAMFENCRTFNQDLYAWDVSSVTSMHRMFIFDVCFRGDLTDWDCGEVNDFGAMLDCTYILDLNPVFNWTISGGYPQDTAKTDITHGHNSYVMLADPDASGYYRLVPGFAFVSNWDPTAGVVTLPLTGSSDASIAWGDNTGLERFSGTEPSHTYVNDPTEPKTIVVRGTAQDWNALSSTVPPGIRLNNVMRCGPLLLKNTSSAFEGCTQMEWDATDTPRFYHGHTLKRAFYGCVSLGNPNFNNWDVSNVTSMQAMFLDASGFDGCMNDWTTVSVNTLADTFRNTSFNGAIGSWNTSKVLSMNATFRDTPFNQNVLNWDVANTADFGSTFQDASVFNQDLYKWNTAQATDMAGMFSGAVAFSGDVTGWDARLVTDFTNIFDNSYSATHNPLFNWLVHQDYSDNALREVTDDQSGNYVLIRDPDTTTLFRIIPANSFLSKWSIVERPCFNITLPTVSAFSDISIDWGGPHEYPTESLHDISYITKDFATDNDKVVLITGNLRDWNALNATVPAGSALKRVIQCGGISGPLQPDGSASAFADCTQMVWNATDTPNIQGITTMESWFENCASMGAVGSLTSWDVSAMTTFSGTFMGATTMDCSMENWDVSNVTILSNTFNGAAAFTQDISYWDVSQVTDMTGTFNGASAFNRLLNDWSVHNVTSFEDTFRSATVYNQTLNDWSMNSAVTLAGMFRDATAYKQNMGNWDISGVTSLNSIFRGANVLTNGDISQWNTNSVVDMGYVFTDATAFNVDLSWNVANVTDMAGMFSGAVAYRGDMDEWDTSACRDFTNFNLPQAYFHHDQTDPPQFSYYKDGIQTWNVSAAINPGDIITHDASNNYMYDISNGIITYMQQRLTGIDVGTSVEFSTYHPNVLIPIRPLATNYRMSMITPSGHHYKYDLYSDLSNTVVSSTDLINIDDSCLSTLTRDQSHSLLFRLQSKQTDPCAQLIINQQTYDNSITISGSAANVDVSNTGAVDVTYFYTVTETRVDDNFKVSISANNGFDESFYDFTVFHDDSFVTLHTSGADSSLYEISRSIPLTSGVYSIRVYAENSGMRGPGFTIRLFGVNPADGIPGEALTKYLRDEISKITIMTRRSSMYPH